MRNNTDTVPGSYPMNGGDDSYSYTKNSDFQREARNVVNTMIDEAIAEKLDIRNLNLSHTSNTFRVADFGCSVGPNTFIAMQHVLEAVQQKYQSQGLTSQMPEFQAFFNDHTTNDFNTLFISLPPERPYFAAGVPGSFYGRLFPESTLHFVHSSFALQWLSKAPEELLDKNSSVSNKGRIHYKSASEEVGKAYAVQFAKDMKKFLDARAKELVIGGMMVLIMPAVPDGIPHPCTPAGIGFELLGSSLMDMAKKGLVSEEEVDSFNLPLYIASPKEMRELVERSGCLSIERMELTYCQSKVEAPINWQANTMHLRAGLEGVFSKHFGNEIIDELFDRFLKKTDEFYDQLNSSQKEATQLLVVLKRK